MSTITKIIVPKNTSLINVLWKNKITLSTSEARRIIAQDLVINFDNNETLSLNYVINNNCKLKITNKYYEIEVEE